MSSIKEQKLNFNNSTKNRKNSPKISLTPQLVKKLVISILIVSFIVGGISGMLFGTLVVYNKDAAIWIQENIFSTSVSTQSSNDKINQSQTISITEDSSTVKSVEIVSPAVVSIVVTQDAGEITNQSKGNLFDFNFGQLEGQQRVGAGTGFVITDDGLILTNKHVVNKSNAEYTVHMNDGTQYPAVLLDSDPFNDIALIKIEASDLPIVEFGDSDALRIGQTVIAIGNALGEYSNTVTKGVVSGLSRTVTANGQSETLEDIIQTDAAINFGNSGGPLINLAGQVIGVNTAISREGQLVGFAIPINQVKKSVESVKENGKIVRPYLGVRYMLITEDIVSKNNLSVDHGALILKGSQPSDLAIIPGSPADKAGLEENDIILEVDGQLIDIDHSLVRQLQKYDPGDTVTLKVLHDGEEKTVEATLAEVED